MIVGVPLFAVFYHLISYISNAGWEENFPQKQEHMKLSIRLQRGLNKAAGGERLQ